MTRLVIASAVAWCWLSGEAGACGYYWYDDTGLNAINLASFNTGVRNFDASGYIYDSDVQGAYDQWLGYINSVAGATVSVAVGAGVNTIDGDSSDCLEGDLGCTQVYTNADKRI